MILRSVQVTQLMQKSFWAVNGICVRLGFLWWCIKEMCVISPLYKTVLIPRVYHLLYPTFKSLDSFSLTALVLVLISMV